LPEIVSSAVRQKSASTDESRGRDASVAPVLVFSFRGSASECMPGGSASPSPAETDGSPRQSPEDTGFPGRAWEPEIIRGFAYREAPPPQPSEIRGLSGQSPEHTDSQAEPGNQGKKQRKRHSLSFSKHIPGRFFFSLRIAPPSSDSRPYHMEEKWGYEQ